MPDLTGAEQRLVLEICQAHARQLLDEINHTDNREYRAGLVDKSTMLDAVIHKLEQATSTVHTA